MKQIQLIAGFLLLFATALIAQPPNDDCAGLIDLGVAPACETTEFYTNIDATASDIGIGNNPLCFNGGTTQNDVWFAFTTSDTIFDYTFTVMGTEMGPNGQALSNPQIAVYRGDCVTNGLAELFCQSAPNESSFVQLDVFGLSINTTYFIRINDYSPSATPNWGDFSLCIQEFVPAVNIDDSDGSASCIGTLFDSGGPDEDYGNGEIHTFTICPQDFHECILIDMVDFNIENNFDFLNFYAGENASAPLIASLTGVSSGSPFQIQATSECVTVEFFSDGSATAPGFELTWQCTAAGCTGSTADNPTVIGSIPYNEDGFTTCDAGATFAETPCMVDDFLNGPEYIFVYDSPGGVDFCASIEVTGATNQTGVLVLDGPPGAAGTNCVASNANGMIGSVDFQEAGTYYIVVANGTGCTDFGLNIQLADCRLSPALEDALCNPLNGCVEVSGLPSIFFFEDGLMDVNIDPDINGGCWFGVGAEPDFYWFTIQAQSDGPFGFILQSGDIPSDIDVNVWGPFTQDEVCETPESIIETVSTTQPLRSTWAAGPDLTGLAEVHPILGTPVEDDYDCDPVPGANGDDFAAAIQAQEGEVYVVLVNDFGNEIENSGILVDWAPSQPAVLAPVIPEIVAGDTIVCPGDSALIVVESAQSNIVWLNDTTSLSCSDCLTPIAFPEETTVYRAVVTSVCTEDTIEVKVGIYDLDAGADRTVCIGEDVQIEASSTAANAVFSWTTEPGVTLSCTDCPNPVVVADAAGTYTLSVTLDAPTCAFADEMTLEVLPFNAPIFEAKDSVFLCQGEATDLMVSTPANGYIWTSNPAGFNSAEPNPTVTPDVTTTYHVAVSNGICPQPSFDSVYVDVTFPPVLNISEDVVICQGDAIFLGNTTPEEGTTYSWTGPGDIEDATNPNSMAFPQMSGTYTLTATKGVCEVEASFNVEVTPIEIDLNDGTDTIMICQGELVNLVADVVPIDSQVTWTASVGTPPTQNNSVFVAPMVSTTYVATINAPGCQLMDTLFIRVDSLPVDLSIMPADTQICIGQIVELITPVYEPGNFMDIEFLWIPPDSQQSPDSFLNLVVNPVEDVTYQRITTNGACVDTASANITVIDVLEIEVIPADTSICPNESVQLTAMGEDIVEYMWTGVNLSCEDCPNPIVTPPTSTQYTVQGMTEEGCPAAGSAFINILQEPSFTPPQDRTGCLDAGEVFILNATPNADWTYSWSSSDPNFSSTSPAPQDAPNVTTTYMVTVTNECGSVSDQFQIEIVEPEFNEVSTMTCDPAEVGVFTETLENSIGCDSVVTTTVTLAAQATLSIDEDVIVCQDSPVTISAAADDPDLAETGSYTWIANGQIVATTPSFSPPTDIAGFQVYVVQYTNLCGTLTDSLRVTVIEQLQIDSIVCMPDTTIFPTGTEVTMEAFFTPPNVNSPSFEWTDEDGNVVGSGNPASFLVINTTDEIIEQTYTVAITTAEGCMAEKVKDVRITPASLQMPNVFTPNEGDELNATFRPFIQGDIQILEFKIYNRWGQKVFDEPNPEGWDGTYNGNLAPSDVYMYYIVTQKPGDEAVAQSGDVTLIR